MATVEPGKPRFTISGEVGDLRIMIPPRPNWGGVAFLGLFFLLWFFAVGTGLVSAQRSADWGTVTFLSFFLLFGLLSLVPALRAVASREVVVIDGSVLKIRRELFGLGRSKDFELSNVRNLRSSQMPSQPWWFGFSPEGAGFCVAFDYGVRTYQFGVAVSSLSAPGLVRSLDEAEARHLVHVIGQRFPALVAN